MTCQTCPNPANCSPTFCQFNDADLSDMKVQMFEPPEQPPMSPSLDRQANERIRRLEAGRAHLLTIADKPGNAWDRAGFIGRACSVAGVIAVCAFVGVVVLT